MGAPWGFRIPERDLAAFHLVVSGQCRLDLDGLAKGLELSRGDLVIVPNGRGHEARSHPGVPARILDDILAAHPPMDGRLDYGGKGPRTDLLCGGFTVEDPTSRRLLAELPPVLLVRGGEDATARAIRSTVDMVLVELGEDRPGTDTVVTRLTDVLLALAIRAALGEFERGAPRVARAWRDPQIAAVLRAIDDRPEHPWTLRELAGVATLSRSVFADRFRAATGESAMRYVSRARVGRAGVLLGDCSTTLEVVAARTGFESAASLSRAFKRYFGMSPGMYRRAGNGGNASQRS